MFHFIYKSPSRCARYFSAFEHPLALDITYNSSKGEKLSVTSDPVCDKEQDFTKKKVRYILSVYRGRGNIHSR